MISFCRRKVKGFTLVELIVVISILAVLSTVSFVAYTNMSSDARNSVRKTDMGEMKVRLRGIAQKLGAFPLPSSPVTLSNSGTAYVSQGWSDTIQTDNGSSFRADPRTSKAYMYATTTNRKGYQIGMTFELGSDKYSSFVDGDYTPLAPYVFPSLLLGVSTAGNFEIKDGFGAGTANRAKFIVNNGTQNLPYDMNGKPLGNATTFSGAITEPNVRLPWSSNYSSCQAIYEGGKSMGPGDYLIVSSTGALTMTGCTMVVSGNLPAAPVASASTSVTATGTTWNWQSAAGATRYEFSTNNSTWSDKGNVLTFAETGLTCGISNTRYVRACNADGCSVSVTLGPTSTNACRGEQLYTTAGSYTWTVPAGVTNVSVVCVGGGGGAGGAGAGGGSLAYANNISVSGTASVNVGAAGAYPSGTGGTSAFGTAVSAAGGRGAVGSTPGVGGAVLIGIGGAGGAGAADYAGSGYGGGGGAGGYSVSGGNGGVGGQGANASGAGSTSANGGGGGAGGWSSAGGFAGGAGGGVGLYGSGGNGVGAAACTASGCSGTSGGNGSINLGSAYGRGAGGGSNNAGAGACRIIWPGASRSFPSTDVNTSS